MHIIRLSIIFMKEEPNKVHLVSHTYVIQGFVSDGNVGQDNILPHIPGTKDVSTDKILLLNDSIVVLSYIPLTNILTCHTIIWKM